MRIATYYENLGSIERSVERVVELEHAGVDLVWIPESYRFDAVSHLAFIAAKTTTIGLGSGIVNVFSRSAALMAMTAAGCDYVSNGRFELGLGTSGPQVVEGFHAVPYAAPVSRLLDYTHICRRVWRREKLEYTGCAVTVPLPSDQGTGLGKPLHLIEYPVREKIPIWWAAIMPRSVRLAATHADGWLPAHFVPDKFREVWGDPLAQGLAERAPELGPLQIAAGGILAIGEHLVRDEQQRVLDQRRAHLALYVGGMGARGKNFYNDICRAYGYEREAELIQDLYLDGHKREAEALVPAEWLQLGNLVGSRGFVEERVAAFRDAGVTVLSVNPVGADAARDIELLREIVG